MKFFISAASKDLGSYRPTIAAHLKGIGHEGLHQAEFPADGATVRMMIETQMRRCDGVICLMGHAFGFTSPSHEPATIRRSYTQIEYELATKSLQKPTFVFIASERAELDPFDQSDEDALEQRKFVEGVREHFEKETGRRYFTFDNTDQILKDLDKCVRSLEGQAKAAGQVDLRTYPLPIARAVELIRSTTNPFDYIDAAEVLLSFLAQLTVQDAVATTGQGELPIAAASDSSSPPWSTLLSSNSSKTHFISELATWHSDNIETITTLEALLDRLTARLQRQERESIPTQVRRHLESLISSLTWLRGYALVGALPLHDNQARIRLLRGTETAYLNVPQSDEMDLRESERLFLLSPKRRMALPLWPALWLTRDEYHPIASATVIADEHAPALRLQSMSLKGAHDDMLLTLGEDVPWGDLPAAWLRASRLNGIETLPEELGAEPLPAELLSDAGWAEVDAHIRPEGEREVLLAGRYRLSSKPLHSGYRTDIYLGVADPDEFTDKSECCVAYLLKHNLVNDAVTRSDFDERHLGWSALRHTRVVRPLKESATSPSLEKPFILAPLLTDRVALGEWLRRSPSDGGRPATISEVKSILRAAAGVVEEADSVGLRLLTLPLRSFLCKPMEIGDVNLTGFDTICRADRGAEHGRQLVQRSRDRVAAPELGRDLDRIPQSVDIFALGHLLLQIRPIVQFSHSQSSLPVSMWNDSWACFAFHCTAFDPAMRFRTITQFLHFLGEWVGHNASLPRTVLVPAGCVRLGEDTIEVPSFRIATNLITNAEYQNFCRNGMRHRSPHRDDSIREAGPWCPVTGVSLDDAEAYCSWLGQQSGLRWRLPTELEWKRAAALDDDRIYAWGNEEPDWSRGNYERIFEGPSVVGACAGGISASGCNDMSGNVWEWSTTFVSDERPLRVLKGGAYDFSAADMSISTRRGVVRTHRSSHVGFRVVCELTGQAYDDPVSGEPR